MMHWLEVYLSGLGEWGVFGGLIFLVSFVGLSLFGLPLVPFAVASGLLFGMAGGLAWMVAASTLGAAAGFCLSRYVARERFARMMHKYPQFEMIDQAIYREGWKIVGLLRICPIPFGISNYAYGLTKVRFRHYLLATCAGMLPGETVFVYLGAAGRSLGDVGGSPAVKALSWGGIGALAVAIFVARRIVTRRLAL